MYCLCLHHCLIRLLFCDSSAFLCILYHMRGHIVYLSKDEVFDAIRITKGRFSCLLVINWTFQAILICLHKAEGMNDFGNLFFVALSLDFPSLLQRKVGR